VFRWLGLDWDEGPGVEGEYGPYFQSQREEFYRDTLERLASHEQSYPCFCTKEQLDADRAEAQAAKRPFVYSGRCRDIPEEERAARIAAGEAHVIRFRVPDEGATVVHDLVLGEASFENTLIGDFVIARADGSPLYNFANVVDDAAMQVTDVIRGNDHLSNTPKQILLYEALGADVPAFAHLPMILDEQGAKLSKRTGAADVMQYRDAGYLPHALLNYLVRLGWSHGDQEVFSIAEMQSLFDLADVNAKAARLDMAKLGWLNQQYLKSDDPDSVAKHLAWHLEQCGYQLAKGPDPADIVIALRDRAQTLKEMAEKSAVWFQPLTHYDEAAVAKHLKEAAREPLMQMRARLAELADWSPEPIHDVVKAVSEALGIGMGKIAQPLRVAITGTQVSPDIGWTVYLCGRDEALARIDAALAKILLESRPASA
jgi:glutamyl-tRNA synthetase